MPVHPEFNPEYYYFVTTKAVKYAHLFQRDSVKLILVNSLHYLRTTHRMKLFAFVIMPNHIHLIAQFSDAYKLADLMRDFKKYTARHIYRRLQEEKNEHRLEFVRREGRAVRQEYKIWEDRYDAREVYSSGFLEQKMNYIHCNPCQLQWKLVEIPEDYPWSSAGFYLADKLCIIPIDDVREILQNLRRVTDLPGAGLNAGRGKR